MHGFRKDLLALLVLAFFILVLFYNPLFTGRTFFFGDIEHQYVSMAHFMYDMGLAGRLSFWNPYQFSGQPFIADPQTAVFYPPSWLYFFVPPARGIVFFAVLHFFLTGLFSYLFLRQMKLNPGPSLAGAAFFTFSGWMILRVVHLNLLASTALIPLVLFAEIRLLQRKNLLNALVLGLVLGIQLLAGNYQVSQMTLLLVLFFLGGSLDFKNLFKKITLQA